MRTTITIDDQLFIQAKQFALESHQSFASVVEDALRHSITMKGAKNKNPISLVTDGEGGLVHGVDLNDGQSLRDIME